MSASMPHARFSVATARRAVVLVLGVLGILLMGCGGDPPDRPDAPPPAADAGPGPGFHIERDRFPSLVDPGLRSSRDVPWLEDADEVIGVVLGGQARAYPITMLAYHHVVNDVIAGIPVLVTY